MAKDKKIKEAAPMISSKEAEKLMAQDKKSLSKEDAKALKRYQSAERAKKYDAAEDTTTVMNVAKVGKIDITTLVEPIRGVGVRVTEVSSEGSVSTTFIPGVKIKKKKAWIYLVEDKVKEKKEKKSK